MELSQKVSQSRGLCHVLYIGLCRENINKYFIWSVLKHVLDIVASSCGTI